MSGMEVLGGLAILGTGVQAISQVSAANAQADAQTKAAQLKHQQAQELLSRQATNEELMHTQLTKRMKDIENSVNIGASTSTALAVAEYQRDAEQAILDSRREAEFKAKMLNAGADIETQLASDIVTGSYLSATGTMLTGAYKIYDIFKPASSTPQPLFGKSSHSSGLGFGV